MTTPMTVEKLIEKLNKLLPDRIVIISVDGTVSGGYRDIVDVQAQDVIEPKKPTAMKQDAKYVIATKDEVKPAAIIF